MSWFAISVCGISHDGKRAVLPEPGSLLRSPGLGRWLSGNGGKVLLTGEGETLGRNSFQSKTVIKRLWLIFFKACKSILQVCNVKPKPMQEAVITVWPKML